VLVAYMSSTGNTKNVAEATYDEITSDKEIKLIREVQEIGAHDLSFLVFPTHQMGTDKKVKEFLAKHCTDGRKVRLFVLQGDPEGVPEIAEWIDKFKQTARGANIIGFFNCQGEISQGVKFIMRTSFNKKIRTWAKTDNSMGQPDEERLENARAFAKDILNRMV
jgi:flavodoxin I